MTATQTGATQTDKPTPRLKTRYRDEIAAALREQFS